MSNPIITVNSSSQVTVGGVNYGTVCDAIRNNPQLAPAIGAALLVWQNAQVAAVAAAQADVSTLEVQINAQLDGATAQLTETLKSAADDTAKAVINGQLAIIASFKAVASQTPAEIRLAALTADIAAKQAELAALTAQ
jgi:hypothetical protein